MASSTQQVLAVIILVVAIVGFFIFMAVLNKKSKKIASALLRRFAQTKSFGDLLRENEMQKLYKDVKKFNGFILQQKIKHGGDPRYVAKNKSNKHYS